VSRALDTRSPRDMPPPPSSRSMAYAPFSAGSSSCWRLSGREAPWASLSQGSGKSRGPLWVGVGGLPLTPAQQGPGPGI